MRKMSKQKPEISFLIASNRNYRAFARNLVDRIEETSTRSYEILLCAPDDPQESRVRWVKDNRNDGSISALNIMASEYAKSDIISVYPDDVIPTENLFDIVDFLEGPKFKDRKYQLTTLASGPPCYSPSTPVYPVGPEFNIESFLIMRFPVVHVKTLKEHLNNHIFHPAFKNHWSDNYLGIFLGQNGEPGIECSEIQLDDLPLAVRTQPYWYEYDKILNGIYTKWYGVDYLKFVELATGYKPGMKYI